MPTIKIDLTQTNQHQLNVLARETIKLLQGAVVLCNKYPSLEKKEELIMHEKFSYWEQTDLVSSPSRIGNNMEVHSGEEVIKPKNKGFYTKVEKELRNRIEFWEKQEKKTGHKPEALDEARALSLLLTFLKVRSKEMLPEVLATSKLNETKTELEHLVDLRGLQEKSGDSIEDVIDLISEMQDLTEQHNVMFGLVEELGLDSAYTKRDVLKAAHQAEECFQKLNEAIDNLDIHCEDIESMKLEWKSNLKEAFHLYKIKADINAQYPLKLSEQAEGFQKYQKFAMPASVGLGVLAIASAAASVGPQAVVTIPLAVASAKASLALSAPGLTKHIGAAIHNKARYGINPDKQEAITAVSVGVVGALTGGALASAAGSAINVSISSTKTVLSGAKSGQGIAKIMTLDRENDIRKNIQDSNSSQEVARFKECIRDLREERIPSPSRGLTLH